MCFSVSVSVRPRLVLVLLVKTRFVSSGISETSKFKVIVELKIRKKYKLKSDVNREAPVIAITEKI